jgi:hypothetical protein
MPDKRPQAMRSTRKMCATVSETVLDLFVDKLLMTAKLDMGGGPDRHAIAELAREFKKTDRRKYLNRAQRIAEDWLSRIEHEIWDQTRKHPFERILVNRFSHLFPPRRIACARHRDLEARASRSVPRLRTAGGSRVHRAVRGRRPGDIPQGEGRTRRRVPLDEFLRRPVRERPGRRFARAARRLVLTTFGTRA